MELFAFNITESEVGRAVLLALIMLLLFYPMLILIRKLTSSLVLKVIGEEKREYIELCKKHYIHTYLTHLFISIYLFFWIGISEHAKLLSSLAIHIKSTILSIYATFFVTALAISILNLFGDIYKKKPIAKKLPIILHTHIAKIIIVCCGGIVVLSKVLSISIASLFTSIGATAAVLSFIFKDTLLGLIASLQLTFQDIVRVGDVVSIPHFSTEGEVESITITVVKIRNRDQTVTTVPTMALLSNGLRNLRGMHEVGARMIRRTININANSIKFCTAEMLKQVSKMEYMIQFFENNPEKLSVDNSITNLTLFRYYMNEYLKHHQGVHSEGFIFMVRQLEPAPIGIPIEVYAFAKETNMIEYEEIQANIVDHMLAILPRFDLKIYQAS